MCLDCLKRALDRAGSQIDVGRSRLTTACISELINSVAKILQWDIAVMVGCGGVPWASRGHPKTGHARLCFRAHRGYRGPKNSFWRRGIYLHVSASVAHLQNPPSLPSLYSTVTVPSRLRCLSHICLAIAWQSLLYLPPSLGWLSKLQDIIFCIANLNLNICLNIQILTNLRFPSKPRWPTVRHSLDSEALFRFFAICLLPFRSGRFCRLLGGNSSLARSRYLRN